MNINSIKDKMNELLDKAYKAGYNDGIDFSEEAHACAADYKPDNDDYINCIRNPEEPERNCANCDHLYHNDDGYSFCDYINNCEMDRKLWKLKQKHIEEHDCSTCGHADGTFESLKNYCKFCAHGSCWVPKTNEKITTNDEADDTINIGDEVEFEGHTGVVVRVRRYKFMNTYDVLCDSGNYWSGISWEINEMTAKKTGRHFDQVAELYEKMKED